MERIISTFEKAILAKSKCGEIVYMSLDSVLSINKKSYPVYDKKKKK